MGVSLHLPQFYGSQPKCLINGDGLGYFDGCLTGIPS